MNGHPLTIRSRIPTEIHAATISVAQIDISMYIIEEKQEYSYKNLFFIFIVLHYQIHHHQKDGTVYS